MSYREALMDVKTLRAAPAFIKRHAQAPRP
jgi:hypothetical protein